MGWGSLMMWEKRQIFKKLREAPLRERERKNRKRKFLGLEPLSGPVLECMPGLESFVILFGTGRLRQSRTQSYLSRVHNKINYLIVLGGSVEEWVLEQKRELLGDNEVYLTGRLNYFQGLMQKEILSQENLYGLILFSLQMLGFPILPDYIGPPEDPSRQREVMENALYDS